MDILHMRDYGGEISCPMCGHKHHVTPRQLQTEIQIVFHCANCGTDVTHENSVAREIAAGMNAIRASLEKLNI
jgi:DNA-directed RNA polymerase subunit RPC12/RpoP